MSGETPGAGTVYRYTVPAPPCGWINANDRATHPMQAHRRAKAWRAAALAAVQAARLPRELGLDLVRIDAVLRFARGGRRDRSNYTGTVKPIVDALTPARTVARRDGKGGMRLVHQPGIGLLLDDNDRIVEGPLLVIGEPLGPAARGLAGWVEVAVTVRDGCAVHRDEVRRIRRDSAAAAARKLYTHRGGGKTVRP